MTWSTVLCAAAVLLLLLSGDEPGDGVPSSPHLSQGQVEATLARAQAASHAPPLTGDLRDEPIVLYAVDTTCR